MRSIAFNHDNEWFCTGSADRTIKVIIFSLFAVHTKEHMGYATIYFICMVQNHWLLRSVRVVLEGSQPYVTKAFKL